MVRVPKSLARGLVILFLWGAAFAVGVVASPWLREAWYLRVLESGPATAQGVAARKLLAAASPRAVPALIRYARSCAADGWRIDGGPTASRYTDVRSELVSGLSRLGGLAALRDLATGLDPSALAILVRVSASHVEESEEIERFLAGMASHADLEVGSRACSGLLACRRTLSPEAADRLLAFAMAEPQDHLRALVAGKIAYARIPRDWMIRRLLATLKSANWTHRWHAARILGQLTTEIAEHEGFRDAAIEALGAALEIEPNEQVQAKLRPALESLRTKSEARSAGSDRASADGSAAREARGP